VFLFLDKGLNKKEAVSKGETASFLFGEVSEKK
jgi:hypothetical protein